MVVVITLACECIVHNGGPVVITLARELYTMEVFSLLDQYVLRGTGAVQPFTHWLVARECIANILQQYKWNAAVEL